MASSGGWLIFSFMLVFLAVEFRTSSCSRCERGLGNCDELVLARALKKRALRPQNCRFACFGKKRETSESLKEHIKIPESERQTVDKVIDEMLQKRIVTKRETDVESSRPPCQRFSCGGKKRSVKDVVAHASEYDTTKKMVSKRKASRLGCWRFGSCKKTNGKETFSSPPIKEVETKMNQRQNQQQQEDLHPKCFRFGCKKRGLGGDENSGSSVAVNEETQERFPPDQDDTAKTRCWGYACKRRNHIQKILDIGVKRFNEQPTKQMRFDSKLNQDSKVYHQ